MFCFVSFALGQPVPWLVDSASRIHLIHLRQSHRLGQLFHSPTLTQDSAHPPALPTQAHKQTRAGIDQLFALQYRCNRPAVQTAVLNSPQPSQCASIHMLQRVDP